MIVKGIKHIVIIFPISEHHSGTAQFNEGNTVPESLIPYVSEGDSQYLKPAAKAKRPPAEASE